MDYSPSPSLSPPLLIDGTTDEAFHDPDRYLESDEDDGQLMIDETSTTQFKRLSNDEEDNQHEESSSTTQNDSQSPDDKPIQMVLNRAKPINHSTQTRYQTRTRSCSLPSRQSRHSVGETPFACDTTVSLLDLATKLSAADKKVNGKKASSSEKRSPGRQGKPPPAVNKTMLAALKKKIHSLNTADEEAEKSTPSMKNIQLPASLVSPESLTNGTNSHSDFIQSPDMLNSSKTKYSSKYQVVKVDLFTQTPEKKQIVTVPNIPKTAPRNQHFLNDDKVRGQRRSLALAQKRQALQDEAKKRELECVKQLEEHRAKEKQKSKDRAAFNAEALEFYNEVLKVMNCLNDDPDDAPLRPHLPRANSALPLWPLLASTTSKAVPGEASAFTSEIESAIRGSTPERNRRKRPHAVATSGEGEDIAENGNVNSGGLNIPDHVSKSEEQIITHLAVNHAIRAKIPKFAKRSFEAAKFAAQSGVRHILMAEEARREKEAHGFGPVPLQNSNLVSNKPSSSTKQFVHISPAPSSQSPATRQLIPVPVSLIPINLAPAGSSLVQHPQPAKLQPVNTPSSAADSPAAASNGTSSSAAARRFKCPECDYKTDNRSHLRRHVVTVHSDIKPFSCYVCEKDFARGEKCKYHIEKEHPDVPYDPKKTRRQHIRLAEDGIQWPLDVSTLDECTADSANQEEQQPTVVENKSSINCQPNNNSNSTHLHNAQEMNASALLKDLVKTSLQDEKKPSVNFSCQHCAYVGRDALHLQKHLASVHAAVRGLKCGVCHYSTGRKHRMISHMKKHGEIFCFYCNFSTMNVPLFQTHLRICSSQWHANIMTCDVCHRIYNNRKQLQTHMSESHKLEVFFCDMCPYSVSDFQEFEQHTETHFSGDVDSQCMKCNEVFNKAEELLAHAKDCVGMASDNVKLKCSLCPFNTNQAAVLQEHLTSHTNEKVISCTMEECRFSARYESTMAQHMKLKHKIYPNAASPKTPPRRSSTPKPAKLPPVRQSTTAPNTRPIPIQSKPLALSTIQPSTTIVQPAPAAALNFSGMAFSALPLAMAAAAGGGLPVSAIPIYANPVSLQPISMPTMSTLAPAPAVTIQQTLPIKPVHPPARSVSSPSSAQNNAAVYDEHTGGLRGHGSGMFECQYCPDRLPFKYRRSYEKHMYKHQKAGMPAALKAQLNNTVVKIKCPVKYCRGAFDTNDEVEKHLGNYHGISLPAISSGSTATHIKSTNGPIPTFSIKNEPDMVIVDSDSDEEEEEGEEEEGEGGNIVKLEPPVLSNGGEDLPQKNGRSEEETGQPYDAQENGSSSSSGSSSDSEEEGSGEEASDVEQSV